MSELMPSTILKLIIDINTINLIRYGYKFFNYGYKF